MHVRYLSQDAGQGWHDRRVRSIRHGGVQLGYRVGGSGPHTVVFLHGLAGHAGEWERTAEALQSEFTTIALDQRGHGTSTRVPTDTSREAFVADVMAVVEHAACPQPVTLVGQSMGAHTALLTAAWRPDVVGQLVMVEGDVGGGGDKAARNLHQALATWPDHFDSYEQARDFFGGDTEHGRVWAQGYEQHHSGWWPRFDRQVMDAVMSPVFHDEWWHAWTSVRASAMLVLAQHSSIDISRIDRMCQLRPSTRGVTIPQARHDLHLEQPEAWIATLRQFLATAPISASQ